MCSREVQRKGPSVWATELPYRQRAREPGSGRAPRVSGPAHRCHHPGCLVGGYEREREERGKKKKSPHQTGQNIELSEPSALGPGQGVRGEIFTFLQAKEGRAGGWREGWERVKENKLLLPLNIHDSSFAKANGKHINPFTTLLNAKRKEKKENKMDEGHSLLWANWKEYENLDHRRLEAQGEESGLWVLFRPVPVGVDTSLIHFPSLQ